MVNTSVTSPDAARRVTVIKPKSGWVPLALGDISTYRELLYFFVWRDIKVRYKQTALGAMWAILQPLALMLLFTLVFSRLAHLSSDAVPYPIFAYTALIPWMLFAQGVTSASQSLVGSGQLISKIYFPRILVPVAAALSFVLDFVISFAILLGLMVYYDIYPKWQVVFLPLFALLAFLTALAIGTLLSALCVRYRDVIYTVPLLIQLWLFASPIMYSSKLIARKWSLLIYLNPMATVVNGFRWCLLGTDSRPGLGALLSVALVLCVLVVALVTFKRAEQTFADVI
jgi:lipopolysaccharide transport system permease protein